jgi:hypothetical protein
MGSLRSLQSQGSGSHNLQRVHMTPKMIKMTEDVLDKLSTIISRFTSISETAELCKAYGEVLAAFNLGHISKEE